MRRAQPDKDTETFNEVMTCLRTAGHEIREAQKNFDEGKKKVKMDIEELFRILDDFPED